MLSMLFCGAINMWAALCEKTWRVRWCVGMTTGSHVTRHEGLCDVSSWQQVLMWQDMKGSVTCRHDNRFSCDKTWRALWRVVMTTGSHVTRHEGLCDVSSWQQVPMWQDMKSSVTCRHDNRFPCDKPWRALWRVVMTTGSHVTRHEELCDGHHDNRLPYDKTLRALWRVVMTTGSHVTRHEGFCDVLSWLQVPMWQEVKACDVLL